MSQYFAVGVVGQQRGSPLATVISWGPIGALLRGVPTSHGHVRALTGTPRSFQFFVVPARVSTAPAQASAAEPAQV